jgi:cytidylate kinase
MPPRTGKPVIVLDGPAGAGKSSVAKETARRLGLSFLDTGAIYRAITLFMLRENIAPHDIDRLLERLSSFSISFAEDKVLVCGEDVTAAIRTPEIDGAVFRYSAIPELRRSIIGIQRQDKSEGLVAEGRDMASVIFPDADLKIFLTASPEARARRRYDERIEKGGTADYDEILNSVNTRDARDSKVTPLEPSPGAIYLDTTGMPFEDVVENILEYAARLPD